jgi:hypothetical protein
VRLRSRGQDGGNIASGVTENSGVLNPELLKGQKGGRNSPHARLRDRIDAIIAPGSFISFVVFYRSEYASISSELAGSSSGWVVVPRGGKPGWRSSWEIGCWADFSRPRARSCAKSSALHVLSSHPWEENIAESDSMGYCRHSALHVLSSLSLEAPPEQL